MKKKEFLLVDGYNIIHAWDELKILIEDSLEIARNKLIEILIDYRGYNDIEIIIVFDAHKVKGNIGTFEKFSNIYVVYTKESQTADTYIETFTSANSKYFTIKVATSDTMEQIITIGHGATKISALGLEKIIKTSKKKLKEKYIENRPIKNNMLLDNLNLDELEILNSFQKKKKGDSIE